MTSKVWKKRPGAGPPKTRSQWQKAWRESDSEEELPDLFSLWSQELSQITPSTSCSPSTSNCGDTSANKSSGNKSPVACIVDSEVLPFDGPSTSSVTGKKILSPRHLPFDGPSASSVIGKKILSPTHLPFDGPSTSSVIDNKIPSPGRMEHSTFSDLSVLKSHEPACQRSKHFHPKGETMSNKIGDRIGYEETNQASDLRTNIPSSSGKTCRKNDSRRSYHNETDLSASLVWKTYSITPEEFQAKEMQEDVTTEKPLDHINTHNGSHHVSNCVDDFSPHKEDMDISEPFMCTDQSPYYPHGERREVPVWSQDQVCEIPFLTDKYPVDMNSMEYSLFTSSLGNRGNEEKETQNRSGSTVLTPQHTNFTDNMYDVHCPNDQTSEVISDLGHQGGDSVIRCNETYGSAIVGEYSRSPKNEDSTTREDIPDVIHQGGGPVIGCNETYNSAVIGEHSRSPKNENSTTSKNVSDVSHQGSSSVIGCNETYDSAVVVEHLRSPKNGNSATSKDISDVSYEGGVSVIGWNETSDSAIVGEYSRSPQNEDSNIQGIISANEVSKDVCFDYQHSTSSGYETQGNDFDSDIEIISNTTAHVKPIKMVIKRQNGSYYCQLLGESGTHENYTEQPPFCSISSVESLAGPTSHREYTLSGDTPCIEIESDSDDPDGEKPHVEVICRQFKRNIEKLEKERLEEIKTQQRKEEKHMCEVKELKERFNRDMVKLIGRHRYDMDARSRKIEELRQRIDKRKKYLMEGKRLLQGIIPR